jgi:hypothetical protein
VVDCSEFFGHLELVQLILYDPVHLFVPHYLFLELFRQASAKRDGQNHQQFMQKVRIKRLLPVDLLSQVCSCAVVVIALGEAMQQSIENYRYASNYPEQHVSGGSNQHYFVHFSAWPDSGLEERQSRVYPLEVASCLVAICSDGLLQNWRLLDAQKPHRVVIYQLDLINIKSLENASVN